MKKRLVVLLTPILILVSCGDSTLFVPEIDDEEQFSIQTTDDGGIFQVDEGIPVEVQASAIQAASADPVVLERLEVTLSTMDGEVVGSSTVEGETLQEGVLPDIGVPDVAPGEYLLTLVLFADGEELSRSERRFFVTDGQYMIAGVTAYPPALYPSSSGIMRVQFSAPDGADPYIRWTVDGEVLREGYASEGTDQVLVKSSADAGAYPVRVELFPTGPSDEEGFPYASSAQYTSQLVVRRSAELGENDLRPESSYYSLFHFLGNLRDDGARVELFDLPREAQRVGDPDLRVTNGVFGYYLDGGSGFRVADFILPVRQGSLSPFSVSARLLSLRDTGSEGAASESPTTAPESDGIDTTNAGEAAAQSIDTTNAGEVAPQSLFRAETTDGDIRFALSVHANGAVGVDLEAAGDTDTARSAPGLIDSDDVQELVVSLLPGATETVVVWFVDGDFAWADSLDVAAVPAEASGATSAQADGADESAGEGQQEFSGSAADWEDRGGTSVIGGAEGFVGVVDEFGIYFRDENRRPAGDLTVFRKAQERSYGDDLLYAAGFARSDETEALGTSGDVRVDAGGLILEPGGSVVFPEFLFRSQDLILEIESYNPAPESADMADGEEDTLGESVFAVHGVAREDGPNADDEDEKPAIREDAPLLLKFFADGDAAFSENASVPAELEQRRGDSGRLALLDPTDDTLALRFRHANGTLLVGDAADRQNVEVPVTEFAGVQLALSRDAESSVAFRIRSILAFTENSSLSQALGSGNRDSSRREGE